MTKSQIDALLKRIEGTEKGGDGRAKAIVNRIIRDLFYTIEDFNIQPAEFWAAIAFISEAGQNQEWGLIAPGMGFEHFLDLRLDEAETKGGSWAGRRARLKGRCTWRGRRW